MDTRKEYYQKQAQVIINNMKKRKFDAYYCDSLIEAEEKVVELLGDNKSIGYGGSMTMEENSVKEYLIEKGYNVIIRENYKTEEEIQDLKKKLVTCDAFFMSSNAVTMDGELINCDGTSNRLSYLLYGPKEVYLLVGMNKVTNTREEGLNRVYNVAAPLNAIRLNRDTPCSKCGECRECYENTICCNTVITRASRDPGRIKVLLIGEELGY